MRYILQILLLPLLLTAQDFEKKTDGIPFFYGDHEFNNTLSGGVNNPEFQFSDIDNDGDGDLFVLSSDGYGAYFENTGTENEAKFTERNLPPGLSFTNWFFFCDIDNDGIDECFTGIPGNYIRLFDRVPGSTDFEFVLLDDTVYTVSGSPLISESVSNPSFTDIDYDGDYDFFICDQSGRVLFYENTGTPENYEFTFITDEWQDILIVGTGKSDKHGAASIDFGDIDGDGDYDLLWGDFFSNSLYLIKNHGTASSPDMRLETDLFPVNDPVNTKGYNMPRLFDIDSDGDNDLFVSVLYDPTVDEELIFYRNNTTVQEPAFEKVTDYYLNLADIGTKSIPAFADLDNDGDLDLVAGNEKNPNGSLYYFMNTGDFQHPEFNLEDTLFTGYQNDLSVAPSLVDIDNDGDYDLFAGTFSGHIDLLLNTGTPELASYSEPVRLKDAAGTEIKFSNYARPVFCDIDNDGDYDLLTGGFSGKLALYINTGTATEYKFEKNEIITAGIDAGDMSLPAFYDYNEDGLTDLIIGNREGEFYLFTNTGTPENPEFTETGEIAEFGFNGKEVSPYFVDLDGDGDKDMFAGTIRGGFIYFENKRITGLEISDPVIPGMFAINVYPNPFNGSIKIVIPDGHKAKSVQIFNINGEITASFIPSEERSIISWNPSGNISSGVYFVNVISANNLKAVKKIIYLK